MRLLYLDARVPCASTSVLNSDFAASCSLNGLSGDSVLVTCNTGFYGGGYATCVTGANTSSFSSVFCFKTEPSPSEDLDFVCENLVVPAAEFPALNVFTDQCATRPSGEDSDGTSTSEGTGTYSVGISVPLSGVELTDWTDDVENQFLDSLAGSTELDVDHFSITSVTAAESGGVNVEVEVIDLADLEEANGVASQDYEFPADWGAGDTEVEAPVEVAADTSEQTEAPTYSVDLTATLDDLTVSDWTDDVETEFLGALATSADLPVNRFEVLSVTAADTGGVEVEVAITDIADLEEANDLATLDFEFPESLGAVETEADAPEVETTSDDADNSDDADEDDEDDTSTLLDQTDTSTLLDQVDTETLDDETSLEDFIYSGSDKLRATSLYLCFLGLLYLLF